MLTRREFLGRTALFGATVPFLGPRALRAAEETLRFDGTGQGWGAAWALNGVGNWWVERGLGMLQAATDVYPSDRRVVAFLVDRAFRDGAVTAKIRATGLGAGVVLRRSGPRTWYAALYDGAVLQILKRTPSSETVLAAIPAPDLRFPVTLNFAASSLVGGSALLAARLRDDLSLPVSLEARDPDPIPGPGDPGCIATTESGTRSGPGLPLGMASARALWVTGPGQEIEESALGRVREDALRALSTAAYEEVVIEASEQLASRPTVLAATTGPPLDGGARLAVVTDLPAEVTVELGNRPDLQNSVHLSGSTTSERAAFFELQGLPRDSVWYWRAQARRGAVVSTGPLRSFRVLPAPSNPAPVTMVVGSCATEFGRTFTHIAADSPDVFVWEGDLNYPDAHGPLAQTDQAYRQIWKDFLATPELQPILSRASFVACRDDHDYGENDCWAETLKPFGIGPWEDLVNPGVYASFRAGVAEVWVLDMRRFADDPALPDRFPGKSVLGDAQRTWLLEGLRSSDAPFKVILAPRPAYWGSNEEQGWYRGYTAERDYILDWIRDQVSGWVVVASGDSHNGTVVDGSLIGRPRFLEVRASPMDIPPPGWVRPNPGEPGVVWTGAGKFYCRLRWAGTDGPALNVELVRVGLAGWGLPDEEQTEVVWSARLVPTEDRPG